VIPPGASKRVSPLSRESSWLDSFIFLVINYNLFHFSTISSKINKEEASRSVYTMDHEVRPWKMVFFHGPTFMVRFRENLKSLWAPH
jgi:hypothetical protein